MNASNGPPSPRAIPAEWGIGRGEPSKDDADATVSLLESRLAAVRCTDEHCASRIAVLESLRASGLDRLPLPGHGRTVARWRALAAVAACDLSLAKLYESHTDALAILAELDRADCSARGTWAVWAAEAPNSRLTAHASDGGMLSLHGTKAWCSGARHITHALVTAWRNDEPVLAAVELAQRNVSIDESGWLAVGMRATGTGDVSFDGAQATQIGPANAYLTRPGFWQGGAGIAACWLGCAAALAMTLLERVAYRDEPHACAHLGAVDTELSAAAALLREAAAWIDANPEANAQRWALRARLATDRAATRVMRHVLRAVGPAPACTDAWFARAQADLPVFLRQSHAERDDEALARTLLEQA